MQSDLRTQQSTGMIRVVRIIDNVDRNTSAILGNNMRPLLMVYTVKWRETPSVYLFLSKVPSHQTDGQDNQSCCTWYVVPGQASTHNGSNILQSRLGDR